MRISDWSSDVCSSDLEQYLLLDEAFEDEVKLFDLTMNYTGDIIGVTSVTTYIDRDILVSRDASALTGSVSADLGFPDAGILLPSNPIGRASCGERVCQYV